MTSKTNARIAGFTFLFYIVVGMASMMMFGKAASGEGTAAKLASIAEHAFDVRVSIVLTLFSCFSAIVLAVTLYGIMRNLDHDLAVMVLACRVAEGVLGAASIPDTLGLLWLATAGSGAGTADAVAVNTLGGFLLTPGTPIGAPFFAIGSAVFSYLLLRGRMVPIPLAWLGVFASVLLVVALPLQLAGFLEGPLIWFMWMPMLAFEVPLGLWLLIKGVSTPAR